MEKTEDKISKEKDRSIKPTQSDQKGEDRPRKNELRLIDLESIKKRLNSYYILSEGEEKSCGLKKYRRK